MTNVNPEIDLSQGIGTLLSNAKAPVVTTKAGKSAPADASVEKQSDPQKSEMQENQGGDLRQRDSTEPENGPPRGRRDSNIKNSAAPGSVITPVERGVQISG
jgi:hypothetical protein